MGDAGTQTKAQTPAKKSADKGQKTDFVKGLKAEYRKIAWPTREAIQSETVMVIIATAVIGLVIGGLDLLIKWGFSFII